MFGLGFEIALDIGRGKAFDVTANPAENLINQAFDLVAWKVRHEIRDHVNHLKQVHGNKLQLEDRNEDLYSLARIDDSSQVLLILFDRRQRQIKFEKANDPTVQYVIRVVRVENDKPIMTHRKYGNELGELTTLTEVFDVVRHCVEVAMQVRG